MKTEDIALFHRIVETGALSETAKILAVPKSSISRRLNQLEAEIGAKLFHRHAREMKLTTHGAHFYEETKRLLAELDKTLIDITDKKAELKGSLRILLGPGPDVKRVYELIFEFMDMNPLVTVELLTKADRVDLIKEHIDVALISENMLINSDVVAKHILNEPIRFYASPNYLKKHGHPENEEALIKHQVATFSRYFNNRAKPDEISELTQKINTEATSTTSTASKKPHKPIKSWLYTNNPEVLTQSALSGKYISIFPEKTAQKYIERGDLVPLFPDSPPLSIKVFLVFPARRYISIVAQQFVDFISPHIPSS